VRRFRKTLLTTMAAALPLGILAAISGPALFSSAASPTLPVQCNFSATVNLNPPLIVGGTQTTVKTSTEQATISNESFSNCTTSAALGTPVASASQSGPTINTPALYIGKVNNVKTYTVGECSQFTSPTTLAALKNLNFTVGWASEQFTGGTMASGMTSKGGGATTNGGGELGFVLYGKPSTGDYSVKTPQVVAYVLPDDAGTAALANCPVGLSPGAYPHDPGYNPATGAVSSFQIDGSTSTISI